MSSVVRISICYSIFVNPNAHFQTYILTVLCGVFVLVNVLVIKPLLCIHIYRQHINSNLGYAICSVHSNLIMIDMGNV